MKGLLALELEGAVRGADRAGEGIAAGLGDEILGLGSVRQALPSSTLMSSSTPPSMPSSASTEMPLAWALSTTRLVIATFCSKDSCEASIITELKKPPPMHS